MSWRDCTIFTTDCAVVTAGVLIDSPFVLILTVMLTPDRNFCDTRYDEFSFVAQVAQVAQRGFSLAEVPQQIPDSMKTAP